ncbi:MAG: DNA repair protein RecN [Eubacterium sp.]|nr:DNA repair protein RecN [Eubacterium sp.]
MLRTLDIENIAVIEKASVDFLPGLNVLTGETGAGKSIVIDSINAILGERTSKELVRHGCDSAYVSACFEDIPESVSKKIAEIGYELDDNALLISRKISTNGKSVCKINGKSATVSMLKEIGSLLVNIHGQHDSQALLNPDYQYQYIDMMFSDNSIFQDYKASFRDLITVRRKLKALTMSESDKDKELELLDYQIKELEDAEIKIGEREELNKRRALISAAEAITNALNLSLQTINGDDENNGVQSSINTCFNTLLQFEQAKEISETFADINDKLEFAKDKIDALLLELNFNPVELEQIEERLDLLFRLSSKYGSDESEMLDFLERAKQKRNSIVYSDIELEKLNAQYDEYFDKTVRLADELSALRKKVASDFEKQVKAELEFLDMPKLQFKVDFQKGNLSSNGFDKIEFLISTNPGEPPKPLVKIASGGELSRIMLAIKNILSYNDTIGTLIFDEIDVGVSGRASQKIGLKLKAVSKNTQVICVTHSAQIASNANEHFLIEKDITGDKTYTKVAPLDFEARKRELARIMGGLEITETLLKSAEELLLAD